MLLSEIPCPRIDGPKIRRAAGAITEQCELNRHPKEFNLLLYFNEDVGCWETVRDDRERNKESLELCFVITKVVISSWCIKKPWSCTRIPMTWNRITTGYCYLLWIRYIFRLLYGMYLYLERFKRKSFYGTNTQPSERRRRTRITTARTKDAIEPVHWQYGDFIALTESKWRLNHHVIISTNRIIRLPLMMNMIAT